MVAEIAIYLYYLSRLCPVVSAAHGHSQAFVVTYHANHVTMFKTEDVENVF